MVFFRRRRPEKVVSISKEIGEFDPTVPGYYRNVESAIFEVRRKVPVSVKVTSDAPVDVSVLSGTGEPVDFIQQVTEYSYGPKNPPANGMMAVVVAVLTGDRANIELTVEA